MSTSAPATTKPGHPPHLMAAAKIIASIILRAEAEEREARRMERLRKESRLSIKEAIR